MQLVTGGKLAANYGSVTGGERPTITSVWRSRSQQRDLRTLWENSGMKPYRVWYQGKWVYPANKPGDSSHEFGLGWDSDVPDNLMPTWIYVRRAIGWTVPTNDEVHAEYPNWRSLVTR